MSRDHRLKLFPSDFWVIDKSMAVKTAGEPLHKIASRISHIALSNVPWVYDFKVRAKVFSNMLSQKKASENGFGQQQIMFRVRREFIFEDSFEVYRNTPHFDPTRRFKVVFVD